MQNDDIKTLFETFDPELSPDFSFIRRLENNLDSVEMVKDCNAAFRRRQRMAAILASVAGFVAGMAFVCLLPVLGRVLSEIHSEIISMVLNDSALSVLCAVLGVASVSLFVAFNSYEISLGVMGRSCRVRE